MRLALVLLFGFVSSVVVSETEYYAETFNSVNVDTILNSDRLFNQYMDCILDVGPCTADGRTLRYILPDALATTCSKCNPKQREIARKLTNHIKNNKPQAWMKFLQKYDPNGEYVTAYEQFLNSSS